MYTPEKAGIRLGTATFDGVVVPIFDTSGFQPSASPLPPSEDLRGSRESIGDRDLEAGRAILAASDPAAWEAIRHNTLTPERGACFSIDLTLHGGNSTLRLRAYDTSGYYNPVPHPYFEGLLDEEVRLTEEQAGTLFKEAEAMFRAHAKEFNAKTQAEASALAADIATGLQGAKWRRVTPEERERSTLWRSGPQPREFDHFSTVIGGATVYVSKRERRGLLFSSNSFSLSIFPHQKFQDLDWGSTPHGFDCAHRVENTRFVKDLYRQLERSPKTPDENGLFSL